MSNVVEMRDFQPQAPEKRPNHALRKIGAAAGAALMAATALLVTKVTAETFVTQREACAITPSTDGAWNSGESVVDELREKGIAIKDVREVTDLLETGQGGVKVCGDAYEGAPGLAGIDSVLNGGNNLHVAND